MSLLANLLKNAAKKVQETNRRNPNVKTADSSIFDKLKEKFEDVKDNVGNRERGNSTNILDQLKNRIDDIKRNNEADPNVETADNSVFEDMKRELDELKAKVAAEEQAEADARLADLRAEIAKEKQAEEDARMAELRAQIKQEEEAKADAARRQREAELEAERRRKEAEIRFPNLNDLNINTPTVPNIPTIPTPSLPKTPSLDDLNIKPSAPNLPSFDELNINKPSVQRNVVPRTTTPPPSPPPTAPRREVAGHPAMTNSNGGSLQLRAKPDMGSPMTQIFVPDSSMIRVIGYSEHSINLDGKDVRFALVDFNGQQGWTFESYLNFN